MSTVHLIIGETKQWESGDGIDRNELTTDVAVAKAAFASIKEELLEDVASQVALCGEDGLYIDAGYFTTVCWLEFPAAGSKTESIGELFDRYITGDEVDEELLDSYLREYWQSSESTRGEVLERLQFMARTPSVNS